MITRVERHIIIKNKEFDRLTFLSKNLYNYVNYILRQSLSGKHDNIQEYKDLIKDDKYIGEYDLVKRLAELKQVDYKGKRVKRGLFQSSIGKAINSDVNGSLNILRKVIGDSFVKQVIANIGLVCNPIRLNLV